MISFLLGGNTVENFKYYTLLYDFDIHNLNHKSVIFYIAYPGWKNCITDMFIEVKYYAGPKMKFDKIYSKEAISSNFIVGPVFQHKIIKLIFSEP